MSREVTNCSKLTARGEDSIVANSVKRPKVLGLRLIGMEIWSGLITNCHENRLADCLIWMKRMQTKDRVAKRPPPKQAL
jgi:hypothetical protein